MKIAKMTGFVAATLLFSAHTFAFAENNGQLSFTEEQVKKDPTFHCDVTDDKGTLLSPTKIKFTADSAINFGTKGKVLEGISVSETQNDYFFISKDEGGDGTVTYTANNESTIICTAGEGGRPEKYNE